MNTRQPGKRCDQFTCSDEGDVSEISSGEKKQVTAQNIQYNPLVYFVLSLAF
jgi:hypothetical protein